MSEAERAWVLVSVLPSNVVKKRGSPASNSCVAKWIRGWSSNLKVMGSIPGKGAYISKKKK